MICNDRTGLIYYPSATTGCVSVFLVLLCIITPVNGFTFCIGDCPNESPSPPASAVITREVMQQLLNAFGADFTNNVTRAIFEHIQTHNGTEVIADALLTHMSTRLNMPKADLYRGMQLAFKFILEKETFHYLGVLAVGSIILFVLVAYSTFGRVKYWERTASVAGKLSMIVLAYALLSESAPIANACSWIGISGTMYSTLCFGAAVVLSLIVAFTAARTSEAEELSERSDKKMQSMFERFSATVQEKLNILADNPATKTLEPVSVQKAPRPFTLLGDSESVTTPSAPAKKQVESAQAIRDAWHKAKAAAKAHDYA